MVGAMDGADGKHSVTRSVDVSPVKVWSIVSKLALALLLQLDCLWSANVEMCLVCASCKIAVLALRIFK